MMLKEKNGETITLLYNDIIKLIPHRHPFLLIDKLTDIIINKSITGIKAVTFNEPFFPGHFPEHPVMPGVLILEAMAQTAACLVSYENKSLSSNSTSPETSYPFFPDRMFDKVLLPEPFGPIIA